jgi:shikimate kinase
MNIVLIGFASSGKSVTANALCRMGGYRCVDLDRVIEDAYERGRGERLPCREIYRGLGADGFSTLENSALRSLSDMRKSVLSTGGRTPIYEPNRPLLKSLGRVVYLKCGVEAALSRMKRKGIPLSMGGTPEGAAEEWDKRDPIYAELADVIIDNSQISTKETARTILEELLKINTRNAAEKR